MSSSRARTRVAALSAVIPVFVAAGPLVTPAVAADPFVASNLIVDDQVVGPNAGYLGLGIGQNGSTAMFKLAAPDTTSSISSVEVTLSQIDNAHSYQYQAELDDTDGLAVYADVNNSGTFDAADKAAGPKSSGFGLARTPTATEIPFKISFATPATGASGYFVAVHPKSSAVSGRRFTFRLDPGSVVTSAGNVPVNAVSTPAQTATADPRMRVDSAAPAQPDRTQFTNHANVPGVEDEYVIGTSIAGGDPAAKVVFFNHEQTTSASAILRRPTYVNATLPEAQVANLAVHTIVNGAAATNTVKIGDGTGVLPDQAIVAKNNQLNNAVYARVVDAVGNLSAPAILSDCLLTNSACETPRGNPVVAPATPTSAELNSGTTAINLSNYRAVPVAVAPETNSLSARTDRAGTAATNADKYSQAVEVSALIAQLNADGTVDLTRTTAMKKKAAATTVTFTGTDAFDTIVSADPPRGIVEGTKIATVVGVAYDRAGNPSAPKLSAAGYTKDIVAPTATFSVDDNVLEEGDQVTIQFSEPMTSGDVSNSTANALGTACNDNTADKSAETEFDVKTPAGADRTWGFGYCFSWTADNSSAVIKLGDAELRFSGTTQVDLASLGDVVHFGTVTDKNGNPIDGPTATINLPAAVPVEAHTSDSDRDGRLDAVDVSFTTSILPSQFNGALANVSAVSATTTVPITEVTTASPINNRTTLRFNFTSDWGTGVVPAIRLTIPAGGTNTGVKDGNGDWVPAFSKVSIDKAMPQPVSAITADELAGGAAGRDGKLDRIYLTYSEPIDHAKDNNPAPTNINDPAYAVPGYTPTPQQPRSANNAVNDVSPKTGSTLAVKTIILVQGQNPDTGLTPALNFQRFTNPSPLKDPEFYGPTDAAGNVWEEFPVVGPHNFTITPVDGAAPYIVSRTTKDVDLDGLIDAIDILFSENVPTLAAAAQFTVTDRTIKAQEPLGLNGVRIVLHEATPATATGDTAAKPTVQYLAGVTDLSGNVMGPESAAVAPTDGAGPAIVGACAAWATGVNGSCPVDDVATTDDGTKVNVFLSEPVKVSSVDTNGSDFAAEHAGATKTPLSAAPVAAADGLASTYTLTFPLNSVSAAADALVKFTGIDKVEDNATTAVKNAQVLPVTALAGPAVTLALTCTVATPNPAYCASTTVNTGITSTASVSSWRFKNTARGTVVDPADYTTTPPPATLTLVEGTHTLYLTGMDRYSRLSNPERSSTVSILTPPQIAALQMSNSNNLATKTNEWSRSDTVRDGDVIEIAADALGKDAAEWAAENGGCLSAHMAINLQPLTGVAADAKRAPSSCALSTTSSQPKRHMVFPKTTAVRTTRFPVGTVVKYSNTDPGALIVDGPNGTIARRHFTSVAARRSWMISDASVIRVPTALVSALPRQANLGYRNGAILRSPSGGFYYVENGVKRPVSSSRLTAWRIPTTTAYSVSATELSKIPSGSTIGGSRHAVGTWIKFSNGRIYQIVKNAQGKVVRRQVASSTALRTRVPSTHVYPANSYDAQLPIDSWLIGYRDGTLLRFSDGTYGVVARGSLRKFAGATNTEAAKTFNTLGFNGTNALTFSAASMPRVSGQGYRPGADITRYKLGDVVITVTNKAGSTVTAKVPNTDGLYGVGTIDAVPPGWDTTR